MITAQIESFRQAYAEMEPLFQGHYDDISLHKGRFGPEVYWEEYFRQEDGGALLLVTLRKSGKLVGYFVGFIGPALHYRSCLTFKMDAIYIAPEARAQWGGIKLLRTALAELRRRGVQHAFVGDKQHRELAILYRRVGFRHAENYYTLWLE